MAHRHEQTKLFNNKRKKTKKQDQPQQPAIRKTELWHKLARYYDNKPASEIDKIYWGSKWHNKRVADKPR